MEDKSLSYLFWLSEYLSRKLLLNIGPNAAVLLRFFEMGEMASKGRIDDLEYQPTPQDIADFITSGTWKSLDAEWMQRFGEVFLQSLLGMQGEIDALAAYIPGNAADIKSCTPGKAGGLPIIFRCRPVTGHRCRANHPLCGWLWFPPAGDEPLHYIYKAPLKK